MTNSSSIPSRSIAERILDSFPGGTYAITGLLRLLEIVETTGVETAAVECSTEPRLLINPEFVDRWARSSEHLFILVLHEIHHVLLGHTRLFRRITSTDNLVFDAVINAMICRMFPGVEFISFFQEFYSDEHFPECLLRPPSGWKPERRFTVPPALLQRPEAAAVYRALYSERGASYEELYDILKQQLQEQQAAGPMLLGNHQATPDLPSHSPVLFEGVRQIVERWPQPPDPLRGRSLSSILSQVRIRIGQGSSNRSLLRRLLEKVGGVKGSSSYLRRQRFGSEEVQTPVFVRDRRSVVLSSLSQPVLLYRNRIEIPRLLPSGQRVHVYLDVSGSIGDLKGALYRAVLDCREFVFPKIHLFSTRIHDISLTELRQGKCESTWGTSIDCVAEDLLKRRVSRAVVITDGYVGKPEAGWAEVLGRVRLGIALTPGFITRLDLEDVADHWVQLNPRAESALECGSGSAANTRRKSNTPRHRGEPS